MLTDEPQLGFDFAPQPREARFKTIAERFEDFHRRNPGVYRALVRLAREAKERGRKRLGMKALVERARWDLPLETTGEPFKICNSFTAYYARLIMEHEPDLEGMFELRGLRSE